MSCLFSLRLVLAQSISFNLTKKEFFGHFENPIGELLSVQRDFSFEFSIPHCIFIITS